MNLESGDLETWRFGDLKHSPPLIGSMSDSMLWLAISKPPDLQISKFEI
jgi:hypothetical protein